MSRPAGDENLHDGGHQVQGQRPVVRQPECVLRRPLPELPPGLAEQVEPWRGAKDAMRLPHDRPLPLELVAGVLEVLASRGA